MNTMQWILVAVGAGIISLYFLKLRRTPREVPSTYLWLRSIEDYHVNSLFQRLRRNLLLLLQLLVLGLLFSSFFPLTCTTRRISGLRYVFLIDHSASMRATDVHPSRLQQAKQLARDLVDQMTHQQDAAMVIAFSDQAQIMTPFTRVRSQIKNAIHSIQPTESSTSLREALVVAAGLANPTSSAEDTDPSVMAAELYIFSDGGFEDVEDFALGNLNPHFITVGESSKNLGIVTLSSRISEDNPDQLQVFTRIQNFDRHQTSCSQHSTSDSRENTSCACQPVNTYVELFTGKEMRLQDAGQVTLLPGQSQGLTFDIPIQERETLKLKLDVEDDLATDNIAWLSVNPPRTARVLRIGPDDNPFLDHALTTAAAARIAHLETQPRSFLNHPEYPQRIDSGLYDLIIYDRCAPDTMPASNTWILGRLPPVEGLTLKGIAAWPVVLDGDSRHPLMHYVSVENIEIRELARVTLPAGARRLIQTDQGPALFLSVREGYHDLVMTFDLVNNGQVVRGGWQAKQSFPVFVYNVLRELGKGGESRIRNTVQTGEIVQFHADRPYPEITILPPKGDPLLLQPTSQGDYLFHETSHTGTYEIVWPDRTPPDHFVVNLFDPNESKTEPRSEMEIGFERIQTASVTKPVRQELWRLFLLLAIAVLILEWFVYRRRVAYS